MGLLYGNGDPDRTITIATRCGQDSDCNPASAAGILFTTIGCSKLPERFTSGLDTTTKFNSTPYTFPRLIAVCEQLADQAVRQAGGRIDTSADGQQSYLIPVQAPRPAPWPRAGTRVRKRQPVHPAGDEADSRDRKIIAVMNILSRRSGQRGSRRSAQLQFGPALAARAGAIRGTVRGRARIGRGAAAARSCREPGGWGGTRRAGPSRCWAFMPSEPWWRSSRNRAA